MTLNVKDGNSLSQNLKTTIDGSSEHIPHHHVDSLPALPAGTSNIGDVDIASIAAGDNNIGNVDIVTMPAITGSVSITGSVDTELPAAAALADNTVNPTVPGVGAFLMGFDGATWDRVPVTSANGVLVDLGANNDVVVSGTVAATQSGAWNVGLNAGTNNIGDVDVLSVPAPLSTTGGGVEAGALRVTIANDSTGVLSVDDNGSSLTVDGAVSINAALPAGANNIGDVDIASAPTGASSISVQGTAAADAPVVGSPVYVGGRASAAAPTDVTADGDVVPAWRLRNGAAATVLTAAGALIGGDAPNGLDVDVTRLPSLPAGSNNIGDVDVLTLPSLPAGTNNIGDVDVLTLPALPAGSNNIGDVDIASFVAGAIVEVQGDVAHDAVAAGNPVLVGGFASSTAPTAVSASGDAVRLWALLNGALAVNLRDASGNEVSVGGGTQFAEDAAHVSGDKGTVALVVRNDAGGSMTDTDGDYATLQVDANGALRVTGGGGGTEYTEDIAAAGDPVGTAMIMTRRDTPADLVTANLDNISLQATKYGAAYVQIVSSSGSFVDTFGGGTQYTEDVAAVADPVGNALIARRRDSPAAETDTDGDNTALNATSKGELYVKHLDSIAVTDNAGSLTVDGSVSLAAAIPAGTNNIGDVDVLTLPSIPAGNNNIGDVDIASAPTGASSITVQGTAATDAPVVGNPVYTGGRASAAAPANVSADGDVVPSWHLLNGSQVVNLAADGTLITGDGTNGIDVDVTRVQGTVAVTQSGAWNVGINAGTNNIGDVDVLTVPAPLSTTGGGTEATALRVTIANDSTGVLSVDDNGSSLTVDGTVTVGSFTGGAITEVQGDVAHDAVAAGNPVLMGAFASSTAPTNVSANADAVRLWALLNGSLVVNLAASGTLITGDGTNGLDVDVTRLPAPLTTSGGGTEAAALRVTIASDSTGVLSVDDNGSSLTVDGTVTANLAAGTNNIGDVDVLTGPTGASAFQVQGTVAHDSVDANNPVKIGGVARTANPTAVASGDRVDAMFDDIGRQAVVIGQVRDLMTHQPTTITNSTAETTILTAGAAGVFHDLTQLIITNASGTAVTVTIKDATAGSTRMILDIAANGGGVFPFARPVTQAAAANNWTATLSVNTVTVHIFAQAEKNV